MKTEKSRKLKGSVLFTVVSVLSIMIIFLTCTLAMAAAANKRSRKTYSSSQSTYTARAAIDSILAAIGTNTDFSKSVRNLKVGGTLELTVDVNNPSMGRIENAKIQYAGTKTVYDPGEAKDWVIRNVYKITADVIIGGERTTISTNILQDAPKDTPVGNSAGFLTYGEADLGNGTSAWGGTYIGMGNWGDKTQNWKGLVSKYNNYNAGQYITVQEGKYRSGETYTMGNDATQNAFEAPFIINGNLELEHDANFYYTYQNGGISNPGVQIWGDLKTKELNNINFHYSETLAAYIKTHGYKFINMPYIYIDGTIDHSEQQDLILGTPGMPLNIIMGHYSTSTDAKREFNGDLYLMDEEATNTFEVKSTKLSSWASSVVNSGVSYSTLGGNVYCNGNLEIAYGDNGFQIDGDVIVKGDFTIRKRVNTAPVKINGNVVVGGNFYIMSDNDADKPTIAGNVYCDNIYTPSGKSTALDTSKYEKKTIKYYRCMNVGLQYDWGVQSGTVYMSENNLKDAQKTYGVSGTDFGNKAVEPKYYDEFNPGPRTDLPAEKEVVKYYVKGTDTEVSESTAMVTSYSSKAKYTKLDSKKKSISDWADKDIYPSAYTRESLMGIEWPVKGTEHRIIRDAELPASAQCDAHVYLGSMYTSPSKTLTLQDQDCTLTGSGVVDESSGAYVVKDDFVNTVTIKAVTKDVYVKLQNVTFTSPAQETTDADGKKTTTITNTARIDVVEQNDHHVYFVVDGFADTNYSYKEEHSETKLLKTVWDWMDEFQVEAASQKAPSAAELEDFSNNHAYTSETTHIDAQKGVCLKGSGWKNVTIDAPAKGEHMWVVLDGFETQATDGGLTDGILINDVSDGSNDRGGEVWFYVIGTARFKKANLMSQKFANAINSGNDVHIYSTKAYTKGEKNQMATTAGETVFDDLRIKMFSAPGAKLGLSDGECCITAYVKAINMDVWIDTLNTSWVNKIVYDGKKLGSIPKMENQRISIVGCLNVNSCNKSGEGALVSSCTNQWMLLYVSEDNTGAGADTTTDAEGLHTYDAIEYTAYVS